MRVRRALVPYWQVARRSFQRFSTYRGASAAGVFTNTVFAFLKVYVLLAVYRHRSHVGSFDAVDVVTFTFVAEGLAVTIGLFLDTGLGNRIRTGDVVSDLYRPLHFAGYWLSEDIGRAGFHLLARGIPPVVVGAAFFELRVPHGAATWVAFGVSVALAVVVSFAFRFLVTLAGFRLLDIRGPWQIASVVMAFFGGFVVPLTFFPPFLEGLARALPFASMLQLPVEVFIGKHDGPAATLAVLGQQALWAAVLLGIGELAVARAVRRVVVQGG
jgi:ABC-2 type transport system permease protein